MLEIVQHAAFGRYAGWRRLKLALAVNLHHASLLACRGNSLWLRISCRSWLPCGATGTRFKPYNGMIVNGTLSSQIALQVIG